jgi:hypothetical protein
VVAVISAISVPLGPLRALGLGLLAHVALRWQLSPLVDARVSPLVDTCVSPLFSGHVLAH